MRCRVSKISVGRQHRQIVPDAKLCQQRVDRPDLNAAAPTSVAQLGGVDVVAPVGNEQRQRGKPIEDLPPIARPGKALQKLLQNKTGGQKRLAGLDGANQLTYHRVGGGHIAPQHARPDAGIDEEAQRRVRSAL